VSGGLVTNACARNGRLTPLWNFFRASPQYIGEVDDAKLLRRACNGNESAFSELFGRYQRRIYQYAARMATGTDFSVGTGRGMLLDSTIRYARPVPQSATADSARNSRQVRIVAAEKSARREILLTSRAQSRCRISGVDKAQPITCAENAHTMTSSAAGAAAPHGGGPR